MAALNTNVLVRFLVQDDPAQLAVAEALFRRCIAAGETMYVPVTVALELEWVLRSNFGFVKVEVQKTLSRLLSTTELRFDSEGELELALALYGKTHADFDDCLYTALAGMAGEQPLWTFDKAAAKISGAQLLTS